MIKRSSKKIGGVDYRIRLTRKPGVSILNIFAVRGRTPIGTFEALWSGGDEPNLRLRNIESFGSRGSRIGTRMYEIAANIACEEFGAPLASDTNRTDYSEGFWYKQFQKGRAVYECNVDDKWKKCKPGKTERERQDMSLFGHTRYKLKACPAPTNLEGLLPKRRSRRR